MSHMFRVRARERQPAHPARKQGLAASFVLGALIAIAAWVGWMAFTDRMWYEETRVWLAAETLGLCW